MIKYLCILLLSVSAQAKTNDDFQALIVSSENSFVDSEKNLEFATTDANRLVKALVSAGQVPEKKIIKLENPTLKDFQRAVATLSKNQSQKFMFYFSGHSDENGLHLRDGSVTKSMFHDSLAQVSAKVKIVVLDSCFSGALKTKGVKKDKPIEMVQYNIDEPTGSVILTSSSGTEFSYESDKLRGSIFTYHLVSGLYGQADANADGLVTIDELYQYVYSQTKFQSMVSGGKVQSPEFESKLTGQGALVVSFPSRINGQLQLGAPVQGELTMSSSKGINFFKFFKNKGEEKTISLPKGKYDVTLLEEERVGTGQMEVLENQSQTLNPNTMVWQKRSVPSVKAKGVQSKFLFGLSINTHPAFYKTEEDSVMGEFFVLSPSTEALKGRWRLAVHAGSEDHKIKLTQEKIRYTRLTIGGEGNYPGINSWGNEWLVGFRFGTIIASDVSPAVANNPDEDRTRNSSLSNLYFGSRFFPSSWNFNWSIIFGIDTMLGASSKGKSVGTIGVALSF